MDITLTIIAVFAVFIPALILPGPDFIAVVRSSMKGGPRAGLCFYATLSLAGLSAILAEFQWLTWLVRVLGGSYLVYLGFKLLRDRPATPEESSTAQAGRHSALLFGFVVTLTNPKAIVLFASVFATAVSPETPTRIMVLMVVLVGSASFIWYSIVTLFMSSELVVRRFENVKHRIERAAGICFIGIGGKVISDARSPIPS